MFGLRAVPNLMLILAALILQIILIVIVPIWFLVWLAFYEPSSYIAFYAKALLIGVFIAFLFLTGRWDIAGIWLRYLWIGAFILTLALAQFRYRDVPVWPHLALRQAISLAITVATIAFFANALWALRNNTNYDGDPIELTFPLDDARWYVAHGGSEPAMNHHAAVQAQAYALDITGLNGVGIRAVGLLPKGLEAYAIFGRDVVAPCSGEVTSVENSLPDLTPPNSDRTNPAGNHVVVRCGDVAVVLAHLQQGTVLVHPGNEVAAGQNLAKVGNSGNTTEPHLHIHAIASGSADLSKVSEGIIATGEPIPMLFDGAFLTRNAWGNQR